MNDVRPRRRLHTLLDLRGAIPAFIPISDGKMGDANVLVMLSFEAGAFQIHLRDHGRAADVSKVTATVTLLTGTERQPLELKPAGDKLESIGSFKVGPGTKAVAVVTVAGKPATVRFGMK